MMMKVKQIDNHNNGLFQLKENEIVAGELSYTWINKHRIRVDHTDVNADFGGKGVGKALVMALVEFAREKQITIQPVCAFAKSVFDKTQEIRDVLFSS